MGMIVLLDGCAKRVFLMSLMLNVIDLLAGCVFTDLDVDIIKGCLKGQTYDDIAFDLDYSESHIQDKAYELFRFLSSKYNISVKKKNIKSLFFAVEQESRQIEYNAINERLERIEARLDRLSLLLTELLIKTHC